MVGNNVGLIKYAISNTHTTPRFVNMMNDELRITVKSDSCPVLTLTSMVINTDPTKMIILKRVKAFYSVTSLVT
jgi:hypothetical protein